MELGYNMASKSLAIWEKILDSNDIRLVNSIYYLATFGGDENVKRNLYYRSIEIMEYNAGILSSNSLQ
jgi:hypothetical protein